MAFVSDGYSQVHVAKFGVVLDNSPRFPAHPSECPLWHGCTPLQSPSAVPGGQGVAHSLRKWPLQEGAAAGGAQARACGTPAAQLRTLALLARHTVLRLHSNPSANASVRGPQAQLWTAPRSSGSGVPESKKRSIASRVRTRLVQLYVVVAAAVLSAGLPKRAAARSPL